MGAVQPSIKVSQLIEVQYLLPKCKHQNVNMNKKK